MAGGPMRYEVPGWGVGELWMRGRLLLAHEFRYELGSAAVYAHPPKGAFGPPTGTLAPISSRGGDGTVSSQREPVHTSPGSSAHHGSSVSDTPATRLVESFRAFLAGDPVAFDHVELDLDWATPFQHELTRMLRAIPRGEVVTYGELAALAGRPGAARAAGTFCATNRFAIVVPCHRVVAASGIGGYGPDGVPIKRRLLALEGVDA